MNELIMLLRQGNKSAFIAAIVNGIISLLKGIAFFLTGNVAMFAEMLHSLGDAANQLFVFIGTALSKKAPTDRFPNGFGRLVNLVLLGAVLVVGIMSYETIKEGIKHILHPAETKGFLINIAVLGAGLLLESYVLFKAMKEIVHETNSDVKGIGIVFASIKSYRKATPATKLVFLEDSVATSGGLLAILSIIIARYTAFDEAEGIASVIIGIMMFIVVGRVFLDNAAGVLGEVDAEIQFKIGTMVMQDPDVRDIEQITVLKEGESVHVEVEIELDPQMTVAEADDIKDRIIDKIMQEEGVADVLVEFEKDDHVQTWKGSGDKGSSDKK